jgi:hypothetical protein
MMSPWRPVFFQGAAVLVAPMTPLGNTISYDASQFLNSTLAILSGAVVAALAMRVVPPVPPAMRARRLLALTLVARRRSHRETYVVDALNHGFLLKLAISCSNMIVVAVNEDRQRQTLS